jgi:Glutaredoxin
VANILIPLVVIGCIAVLVAQQLRKRKPEPPTQQPWSVPQQLDRTDFARPEAPWIAVVFTSSTCNSCAKVRGMAEILASEAVAVDIVDFQDRKALHERYGIDAVPTTVMANAEGVVGPSFVGPVSATDFWAAMAELREPGSTPPPEAHGPRSNLT